MGTKCEQDDSAREDLRLLVIRLAKALFDSDSAGEVTARLEAIARTELETASLMEYISGIVAAIWCWPQPRILAAQNLQRNLDALAFEMVIVSGNWKCRHGRVPPEAAIVWAANICCGNAKGTGFDSAIWGLCEFVTEFDVPGEPTFLVLQMARSLLTLGDGQKFPTFLWLLSCASVACLPDQEGETIALAERLARAHPDPADLWCGLSLWWDRKTQELTGWGRQAVALFLRGDYRKALPVCLARRAAAVKLQKAMLARVSELYTR